MEKFNSWDDVPDYLATKTQLSKAGLRPAPDQKPAAIKTGGYGPYDLYDKRTAVPKRKLTEAQQAAMTINLEKARAALYCVDCHIWGGNRLDSNGRCRQCRQRHKINLESQCAGKRLAELGAANDWLVVDTETTGLEDTAEIIQIGIVDTDGRVLLHQLIKPRGSINPDAVAVHGLDDAAVADAPTWVDVYPDIAALLNGRHLLAYNADFDRRMITQTCQQYGVDVPAWAGWECVMKLIAAYIGEWSDYWGGFRWHKLTAVYSILDLRPSFHELPRAHDAAGDAWLTWNLVRSFRESE